MESQCNGTSEMTQHIDQLHICWFPILGDLTDAKYRDLQGSKQFKDEWETYHKTVQHCQQTVKTWLDLRGNHGNTAYSKLTYKSQNSFIKSYLIHEYFN